MKTISHHDTTADGSEFELEERDDTGRNFINNVRWNRNEQKSGQMDTTMQAAADGSFVVENF